MKFTNSFNARLETEAVVPYISFPVLSEIPFVRHGFSTKLGGVSSGIFSSLNLGSDSAPDSDDPANIKENFHRISAAIGIDPHSIVVSHQVHKTNIRLVTKNDCGKGLFVPRDYSEIDGLITNEPGITLVTKYADCVPLFFVDKKNKAIGLTHSGWRGTVNKIGLITVKEMQKHFGSAPEDLVAVVGPSICQSCYEVGEEVAAEFVKAFSLQEGNTIVERNPAGRYQLNLWEANRSVLSEAGLSEENIHISGVCTCCHSELLFSHRKTMGKRGSLAAFLAINQDE